MAEGAGGIVGHIPLIGPLADLLFGGISDPMTLTADAASLGRKFKFNRAQPLLLPDIHALLGCWLRRIPEGDSPFRAKWLDMALQFQGMNLGQTLGGLEGFPDSAKEAVNCGFHAWGHVMESMYAVPGVEAVMDARRRNFIDDGEARKLLRRAGGHTTKMLESLPWLYDRPAAGDIIDATLRGRLPDVADAARLWDHSGSQAHLWAEIAKARASTLSPIECLIAQRRGLIPDGHTLDEYLTHAGYAEGDKRQVLVGMLREVPGVADLTMMGIREAFRPELGSVYRYYDEFPELTRPWYAKLGLDYPTGIQLNQTDRPREATLADLYWAAHWHPMPLGQAYLAYQRFQPDLLHRFTEDNPGLKPFGLDDLKLHMRIADLPPGVRDWMVALSHPVLGQRQIQYGAQFLGWSRGEMQSRYRLLGYTTNDAAALASIAEARSQDKDDAWKASIVRRAHTQTVSEIEGMYDEGIIDRDKALQQLSAAGLPDTLSSQLLDLSDARRSRGLLRAAVAATGRDYLSGALSAAEATSALSTYGITTARAGELMQIWSVRRSRHRRQADTSRILRWVATGRLSATEGKSRLGNLGWTDPDVLLLLADAEASLAKLQARERKLAESDAAKRARELERLAREAKAAEKRLLAEANRVAPRGVLTRWLIDHVITEAEYRQGMRDRGYPDNLIDDYVRDATSPKASKPRVAPPVKPFPRPEGTVHPGVGVVKKWAKDGIIDRAQFEEMIRELGYSDSDTARFVADQYPAAP